MDKTDFSRFGKTFQDKLTYLILTERAVRRSDWRGT